MRFLRATGGVMAAGCLVSATAASAQELKIALSMGNAGKVAAKASPPSLVNGPQGARLSVTCSPRVDCKGAAAPTASASWQPDPAVVLAAEDADAKRFGGSVTPGKGKLVVKYGGKEVATVDVTTAEDAAAAANQGNPPAGTGERVVTQSAAQRSLHDLIAVPATCLNSALSSLGALTRYDAETRTVRIAITPLGALLTTPPDSVSEADTMEVHVVGNAELLPYLTVRRASELRTLGAVNIVGGDVKFAVSERANLQAAGEAQCATRRFFVRDFAPGRGEISVVAVPASGAETILGKTEFPVSALYSGMFSLGAIWSDVQDSAFSVVSSGTTSVVSASERGTRRLLYSLLYTPFVWGKRDLQRPERWDSGRTWYHHLNPTVGIVLNDVPSNAIAGVSFDFGEAFVLTYGLHVAHVREIDPDSGLAEGAAFTGTTVPTVKRWRTGQFFGVSIDLRAAVQLLRTATSAR